MFVEGCPNHFSTIFFYYKKEITHKKVQIQKRIFLPNFHLSCKYKYDLKGGKLGFLFFVFEKLFGINIICLAMNDHHGHNTHTAHQIKNKPYLKLYFHFLCAYVRCSGTLGTKE